MTAPVPSPPISPSLGSISYIVSNIPIPPMISNHSIKWQVEHCRFTVLGIPTICGCIWDLILSPSTMQCVVSGKSEIYRKILWIHLLINVVLFRATGVSLIALDFIVNMWPSYCKYGASCQITMTLMWLQWLNSGTAIFHKLSNWWMDLLSSEDEMTD